MFKVKAALSHDRLTRLQGKACGRERDAGAAMTLVNVRWLLDRDGEITITSPAGHVDADELTAVLAPTA